MKKGFTLAEVLVTLGLIGVIAALTIPALMSNIDRNIWTSGLRNDVNILSNAFAQMMANEDIDDLRDSDFWASYNSKTTNANIKSSLGQYFKLEKPVTSGMPKEYSISMLNPGSTNIKLPVDWTKSNSKRFYLSNSTTLQIVFSTPSFQRCDKDLCASMADILIDTNGDKGPNVYGKDVHAFILSPKGELFAYGSDAANAYKSSLAKWDSTNGCKGKQPKNVSGLFCTQRVLDEGYKISYY